MATQINFSSAALIRAPDAPTFSVSTDSVSGALVSVDSGGDVVRTTIGTTNVSSRATITASDNGLPVIFQNTNPRVIVSPETGRVTPAFAECNGAPVSTKVPVLGPVSGLFNVPVSVAASTPTGLVQTYSVKAGTVAAHVEAAVSAMLAGRTPGDATQALYSTNNYSRSSPSPVVSRNAALFCGSYDWTGMSVMSWDGNTAPQNQNASPAHLISPIHAITANHYTSDSQEVYIFQGADGTLHTRVKRTGRAVVGTSDVCIIAFDQPLPVDGASRVTPFKLLPSNYRTKLWPGRAMAGTELNGAHLHCLKRKRWSVNSVMDTILVCPLYRSADADTSNLAWVATTQASPSQAQSYAAWNQALWISGDSGSGVFLPINGELVFVAAAYSVNQQCPSVADQPSALIAAMDAVVSGYSSQWPKISDLSGFSVL